MEILDALMNTKGIQLPMASSILRFKNKNIYQIIDQRVYRIVHSDKRLKLTTDKSDKSRRIQIDLYLEYLKDLREVCTKLNIPFDNADRVLYMADKRINRKEKLEKY